MSYWANLVFYTISETNLLLIEPVRNRQKICSVAVSWCKCKSDYLCGIRPEIILKNFLSFCFTITCTDSYLYYIFIIKLYCTVIVRCTCTSSCIACDLHPSKIAYLPCIDWHILFNKLHDKSSKIFIHIMTVTKSLLWLDIISFFVSRLGNSIM